MCDKWLRKSQESRGGSGHHVLLCPACLKPRKRSEGSRDQGAAVLSAAPGRAGEQQLPPEAQRPRGFYSALQFHSPSTHMLPCLPGCSRSWVSVTVSDFCFVLQQWRVKPKHAAHGWRAETYGNLTRDQEKEKSSIVRWVLRVPSIVAVRREGSDQITSQAH